MVALVGGRNLLFFDQIGSFLPPMLEHCQLAGWNATHANGELQASFIDRQDILWFCWGDQMVAHVLRRPWKGTVVVHTRSYEVYQSWYPKLPWDQVDWLVFDAPHVRDVALDRVPALKDKPIGMMILGVDPAVYTVRDKADSPQGNHCACVGRLVEPKNIQAVVDLAYQLPDYLFHLKGPVGDQRLERFIHYHIEQGRTNIYYHPPGAPDAQGQFRGQQWYTGEGVHALLKKCDFILSPSFHEGVHLALLEGVSTGLQPVAQDRPGLVVPGEFAYKTLQEAAHQIRHPVAWSPDDYHDWVVEHRSLRVQHDRMDEILENL